MRIIIVGGGIGGIATAIALHKEGFKPVVLEQAPAILPLGAGVNISANAMKALTYLGVDRHVRETGVACAGADTIGLEDGRPIFSMELGEAASARYGDALYHCHRADVLDALLGGLPAGILRLGAKVRATHETDDGVTVVLDNGEEIRGDLLVGADGLKSAVRERLFGEQPARFTGYAAWRALISAAAHPELPLVPRGMSYVGANRHIVYYPIQQNKFHNFVGFVPADEITRESWTNSGDVTDLRRSFAGACPAVGAIIDAIDEAFITGIYFRDPLATWSTGRTTLLGDAAHPVPPSAAQGACLALEDAVTLAICLRRFGRDRAAEALKDYEARRIPRSTQVLGVARSNLRIFNEADPVQVRARNGYFRGLAKLDPLGKTWFGALYTLDPVKAAETPLAELEAGPVRGNPLTRPDARKAFDLWCGAIGVEDFARGAPGLRDAYGRLAARAFQPLARLQSARIDIGGVPALEICPSGGGDGPVLLHLHGGGFTMGSAESATDLATRLAHAIGARAVVPDYRLAPEHPYPAALDDCIASYRGVLERFAGRPVFFSGEEAGGGLALSLALRARDEGLPMPAGLYLVSPFCDLTLSAASIDKNGPRDPWLRRQFLTMLAAGYIQDSEPDDTGLSPLLGAFSGLPPTLIHAARDEALRDDAVRLTEKINAAGGAATLELFDDSVHAFPLFGFLPESEAALRAWRRFARQAIAAT